MKLIPRLFCFNEPTGQLSCHFKMHTLRITLIDVNIRTCAEKMKLKCVYALYELENTGLMEATPLGCSRTYSWRISGAISSCTFIYITDY